MMSHLKEGNNSLAVWCYGAEAVCVTEAVQRVDPEGSAVRFWRRRQYVMFPLKLWHIDGNHKLRYTIYIVSLFYLHNL